MLRTMISELDGISGRGTELISVYVPHGKQLHEVVNMLKHERGTASNIKSDATRSHVTDSLSKVIQRLSMLPRTPERGIAMFCGMVLPSGAAPGSERMVFREVDPPGKLDKYLYRCDQKFHTDILRDMLKPDRLVGFLALDAKDAGWGILRGGSIEIIDQTSSGVPGKHRQGGQSAKRFQKLREMHLSDYYARVAETTRRHFLDDHTVDHLIISGPGHTKDQFAASNRLEYRLRDKVLGCIDGSYAGAEGVREAFNMSGKLLGDVRALAEKQMVERLFHTLNTKRTLVSYGWDDIQNHISNGSAELVMVADDSHMMLARAKCCGAERVLARSESMGMIECNACGSASVPDCTDMVEFLATECARMGVGIEVINGKAEHGMMLHSLGGAAAILRY